MKSDTSSKIVPLGTYNVQKGDSSISGLSSGAFMTVQLHLAHSASFSGVGVIAGGPFRCAESFRDAAPLAEDAYVQNAEYICMSPLTAQTGPNALKLVQLARDTERDRMIDPLSNLKGDRVYLFTGTHDTVVYSDVVKCTRRFYELLGVASEDIAFDDTVAAGHSIVTENPEDSMLGANQPPYINCGKFVQSHRILNHIYDDLAPPSANLKGRLIRFDQTEFFDGPRASMSEFGYAYVPFEVEQGSPARVHIVLHGCKQGYGYVNFVYGRADQANQAPYGNRYITTTGYNEIADSNNIIVLYPQATGADGGGLQNPDGCWDWWGYTSEQPNQPDYYSRDAIQIKALHGMLDRLGG
ncbi:poly(3-hydroxybutyrate) depolymerase [Paraburkholderia sp.]|uniref:extracellular catalytic domain type 2 short-chain-length polyhydroxyalkanoate depolymerase n=1 Tax=Paraburkholderia sp. TaxID=1926495 RepID=UPI00239D7B88|nr:poly(3-hydroxybutyrate) depolymerase [Paraburkholderia sp.]MDE1179192.1 poly(3-hydroxybutyrate) depolymerase [Paraburkholderia sp.]